ncbi:MAG TPA: Ig-like domain-containing protein, partial [Candidatus Polarisedimenticolaceae bacterium]|nr:Ig-like domain-containing protein [Candidatus Polarisedimenticolaceae bacterium]
RPNLGENGKPAYYSYSYQDPDTQGPVGWPHNPAGLYGMLIESAVEYYQFSGDPPASSGLLSPQLQLAKNVADWQLGHGMTLASDNWSNVPYSSGDAGSLTYNGAAYGNTSGSGDGKGFLQPDKIGELGVGLVQLYKLTGDSKYLDAAINSADALALPGHIRTGSAAQSPWAFRVNAASGAVREQYGAHVISPIELFDNLLQLSADNPAKITAAKVSSYQSARATAWNWMMNYPMKNNLWSGYFEDVSIETDPASNPNQLNPMMVARYLLLHPEYDASWETHVRGLITWVEQNFGQDQFGSKIIEEQARFAHPMGSHTSRYASMNALLYQKTGDAAAKEKAYRSFNWATYMARSNGVVIDGPSVNNQWFTDGYGDYIRHFMVGMGAVPEFAPNGQTHILQTSSLVKSVDYSNANSLTYQTFDNTGIETIKVSRQPTSVTLGGSALTQRGDLNAQGWVYNASASTVQIRRDSGKNIGITLSGTPANQTPSVSITAPANNANFSPPATFQVSATAADSDGTISKVEFYLNNGLVGTDTATPFSYTAQSLTAGIYTYTAKAYDSAGAAAVSAPVMVNIVTADSVAPVISAISTSNININGATINWTTNEPSTSQIEYGLTTSYGSATSTNTSLSTSHTQVVAGLLNATTYHYRVKSADAAGNQAVSADNTFVTPAAASKPGDINGDSAVNIFDLSLLLSNYGKLRSQASNPNADLNNNNTVDIFDLSILLSKYGT